MKAAYRIRFNGRYVVEERYGNDLWREIGAADSVANAHARLQAHIQGLVEKAKPPLLYNEKGERI